ncbi:MAG: SDR family NAD(P)-dependent oxidoreductase, partial [Planctomycetes bacterium]|nr:SDR family NAD(P)-dependent oxidoreductase [Planctomycetota bacterium]
VWSRFMIEHYQARIVWIGRREEDDAIKEKINALSVSGNRPLYIQADAADLESLQQAFEKIQATYPKIHGVVHSAIVLQDQSLTKMEEPVFRASLSAKVDVSVNMDAVFGNEELDFMLFFSSLISFTKAPGQSNYAAGCTFKDSFAQMLGQRRSYPVKIMNWGYWGSVGIVTDESYNKRMEQAGIGSLEPGEAMESLRTLVNSKVSQMALIKTLKPQASEALSVREEMSCYDKVSDSVLPQVKKRLPRQDSLKQLSTLEGGVQTDAMDSLLREFLSATLTSLGLFTRGISQLGDLSLTKQPAPFYERWLRTSITYLEREKYLSRERTVTRKVKDLSLLWEEWERRKIEWMKNPNQQAQFVLLETCLKALPDILSGIQPATDVMFPNSSMKLVEGIYRGNPLSDYFNEVLGNTLVEAIRQKRNKDKGSKIRILEIGAGTGGTTAKLIPMLEEFSESIEEYCYTDLSKAFLMHAEEKYKPEFPTLTTSIFDASKPLVGQPIAGDHYDFVIAANVLHATPNIRETIRNVKATLKNRGILLLNEISDWSLFTHLTFGLLEGWWLYEDAVLRLEGSPGLRLETWKEVLEEEGFESIFFPAQRGHKFGQQIIAAGSDGVIRQRIVKDIQPLANIEPKRQKKSITSIRAVAPQVEYPTKTDNQTGNDSLSSGNVTEQMIQEYVKEVLRKGIAGSLKMNPDMIEEDRSFSEYGVDSIIAVQLINLINKKLNMLLQTTVLFDFNNLSQLAAFIVSEHHESIRSSLQENQTRVQPRATREVFTRTPLSGTKSGRATSSFTVRKRGRFVKQTIQSLQQDNGSPYHRALIEGPGEIEDLTIVESSLRNLQPTEICVSIRAFSLNFGDLLCVRGMYPTMPPYPFTPGFEASGIVIHTGDSVTKVRIGDAVIVGSGESLGAHATAMICDQAQVFMKLPSMSFEDACALPVVGLTMIDAFHKAKLQPGESILIQTAAGGTGLIAVQLAKHYGATIYATAGSNQKLEYLQSLGVSFCINYQEKDFETEIHRLTQGRGVDVVINTLSGDAMQKGLNCLAPGGRYIEIAMTALKSAKSIDLSILNNNQSFYTVDLRKLGFEDPQRLETYRKEMLSLWQQGIIVPTICQTFSFESIQGAYQALSNRSNIGKIVVTVPESLQVSAPSSSSTIVTPKVSIEEDSIAIIGMSGRFAQSESLEEFWENLKEGKDLVKEVSRWRTSDCVASASMEQEYCSQGSFIDSINLFDPLFFKISPGEATYMDPQQRLFLEESWKALEDAGYAGKSMEGKECGVYVGCGGSDYSKLFLEEPPAQAFWGNAGSVIPARIAYYLNLQGPAVAIDTACSSSLVSIHLACQGLWSKEIEMALAGGVFLQSTPEFFQSSNRSGMLSPKGRCHTFDARADGFVPGEGVGVVVLKRLADALKDGDTIHGVIVGSGINQDGNTNGITAPSAKSQERLERSVYDRFKIHPESIQVVEAHGTGTKLGDPIEYDALTLSFRKETEKREFCAIGSVKTNIGHTATAAGVAGVLKLLLALRHRQIPPSLHFKEGNPVIDFASSPFYVNSQLKEWEIEKNRSRRAAVSSFGFSGTNAHLIIEEAPLVPGNRIKSPGYL